MIHIYMFQQQWPGDDGWSSSTRQWRRDGAANPWVASSPSRVSVTSRIWNDSSTLYGHGSNVNKNQEPTKIQTIGETAFSLVNSQTQRRHSRQFVNDWIPIPRVVGAIRHHSVRDTWKERWLLLIRRAYGWNELVNCCVLVGNPATTTTNNHFRNDNSICRGKNRHVSRSMMMMLAVVDTSRYLTAMRAPHHSRRWCLVCGNFNLARKNIVERPQYENYTAGQQ